MNEDRITGHVERVPGYVEEELGQAAADVTSQVHGRAQQMGGALHELYGQAKQTASDAAESVRASASDADDILRTTIEQRPYTTAAIALGIGFLIGRFARRESD